MKSGSSIPKVNFNTTLISIVTTLSYMQSVLALLTNSNPKENMIEILVAELNKKHLNEIKMLQEFKEYEIVEDIQYLPIKNLRDPFRKKISEVTKKNIKHDEMKADLEDCKAAAIQRGEE